MTKRSTGTAMTLTLLIGLFHLPLIWETLPAAELPAAATTLFLPLVAHNEARLPVRTPTPRPSPQPGFEPSPVGIVMYYAVDQAGGLDAMQAAGARRVSTMLDWGATEPVEGQRNWDRFDAKVRNAQAAGMEVYVLFLNDPQWAWKPDRSMTIPEKRLDFVRAMVQRYDCDGSEDAPGRLCVRYWSFYGEPDYYKEYYQDEPGSKGYWGHRGKEYAAMLAGVADVIHAEDPSAQVLIGGLAYDWFESAGGPFVRPFLPDVLGELNASYGGARHTIDAVAVHYYPLMFPSIRDKVHEIRAIMQAHAVGDLPLLVPEAGYWSSTAHGSSDQRQAQRLVQIYVEALSVDVRQLSWFTVFDVQPGTGESGLFRGADLTRPKPAYFAYQTLTHELAGAVYLRPVEQPNVTGYVFGMPSGREKTVVWSSRPSSSVIVALACLHLVTIDGAQSTPTDGDSRWDQDGVLNGQITLGLSQNEPLYVSACL